MAKYHLEMFDLFPEDTVPLKCSNWFTFHLAVLSPEFQSAPLPRS